VVIGTPSSEVLLVSWSASRSQPDPHTVALGLSPHSDDVENERDDCKHQGRCANDEGTLSVQTHRGLALQRRDFDLRRLLRDSCWFQTITAVDVIMLCELSKDLEFSRFDE
jgi:hypothetical protein